MKGGGKRGKKEGGRGRGERRVWKGKGRGKKGGVRRKGEEVIVDKGREDRKNNQDYIYSHLQ